MKTISNKEESQHAIIDVLEWLRENEKLIDAERNQAVTDLIELVGAVDDTLQAQAKQDTEYFAANCNRAFTRDEVNAIHQSILKAYRW